MLQLILLPLLLLLLVLHLMLFELATSGALEMLGTPGSRAQLWLCRLNTRCCGNSGALLAPNLACCACITPRAHQHRACATSWGHCGISGTDTVLQAA